ncbi:SEC-C motif-containing protein [Nocardioides terrae]|uniref:SEC-C motif-containing protein n=1 Tax=Nocardioides terrae TaxID=574651 RepID=A0A1I1NZQ6_9ACTN|nr:YchJ family metal-binding protein [Nocardioides terrae]SFD03161.1 SEC-C motif-containing protein [Nocardioides terrae]
MFGRDCPCGSGATYDACCGRLHRGNRTAGSPLELMRARYSAYVVGDADFVFATWHPRTRPDDVLLDPGLTWTGLAISGHGEDWVEFTASYLSRTGAGELHERSRFEQRAGRWVYLDGETDPSDDAGDGAGDGAGDD